MRGALKSGHLVDLMQWREQNIKICAHNWLVMICSCKLELLFRLLLGSLRVPRRFLSGLKTVELLKRSDQKSRRDPNHSKAVANLVEPGRCPPNRKALKILEACRKPPPDRQAADVSGSERLMLGECDKLENNRKLVSCPNGACKAGLCAESRKCF